MSGRRAVFLDRDNTLNYDPGYLSDPALVELLPGVVEGLTLLRRSGLRLVLISNQAGVGRGYFSEADLAQVHGRLVELLAERDLALDGAFYCLHAPWDGCDCRKPQPGLIRQAARALDLDPATSFMVGDKVADVIAGRRAGCRTVLLHPSPPPLDPPDAPDAVRPNLLTAAEWIVAQPELMT